MPATHFDATSLIFLGVWIAVLGFWVLMETIATTVGLHRLFTHRSFDTTPRVARFLLWWARSAGVKYWEWVHNHLWHHANTDTGLDSYTPNATNWMSGQPPLRPPRPWRYDNAVSYNRWSKVLRGNPELLSELAAKNKDVRRSLEYLAKFDGVKQKYSATGSALIINVVIFTAVSAPFALKTFGWWGIPVTLFMGWLAIGIKVEAYLGGGYFVNYYGHRKRANPHQSDMPIWVMILTLWMLGEGWHEFHHDAPYSARFHKRWDPGWWFISGLRKLRLAKNVRVAMPILGATRRYEKVTLVR